jgi:hypothetical protein
MPDPGLGSFIQAPINGLYRTVEELSCQHHADAPQEQTPFQRLAAKNDGGRHDQGREEKVNKETGMSPDA